MARRRPCWQPLPSLRFKAMEDRITIDPAICNGRPVVRGTRITAQTVLEFLGAGDSVDDVLEEHPTLTRDDVLACLRYASELHILLALLWPRIEALLPEHKMIAKVSTTREVDSSSGPPESAQNPGRWSKSCLRIPSRKLRSGHPCRDCHSFPHSSGVQRKAVAWRTRRARDCIRDDHRAVASASIWSYTWFRLQFRKPGFRRSGWGRTR